MREVRATAAAVVLLILIAAPVSGQCVSTVDSLSARGDSPRFLAGPTAWNGRILAVAGPELDREEFQVMLYDEQGHRLFENEKIRSAGDNLLDVIWNGTDFAVFSVDADDDLALTRVGTDGKVIGSPRTVSIPDVHLAGDDTADILWSPALGEYVVGYTQTTGGGDRTARVGFLKRDGRTDGDILIAPTSDDSFVRLALTSTGTIGVFYEDDTTHNVEYVALSGNKPGKPVTVWDEGDDIVVAARGTEFALVRPVLRTGDWIVRWEVIDLAGRVIRRDSVLNMGTGPDVEPVFLMSRDDEFALSYLEWPQGRDVGTPVYRLLRFGPEEESISDTLFAASFGTRRRKERTEYPFEWTGTGYLSLGSDENGDDNDTYLIRYCPLRASISGPRSARLNQPVTLSAVAEGGVPGYAYKWSWATGAAQGSTVQAAFSSYGVQQIVLTVTDETGTETQATFLLTINQIRRRPVRK